MGSNRQGAYLTGLYDRIMNTPNEALKQITLQVQDRDGTTYQVRLTVDEPPAKGALAILTSTGDTAQRFDLTQVKKGRNGTQLTCTVQGATTTLTLDDGKNPPELRVVATLFLPIFSATYRLNQGEHQLLVQWINALAIGTLA
jgi:hypothetical protein